MNTNYYEAMKTVGDVFASTTRIQILDILRDYDCTVEKLSLHLNTSMPNTSKHLKVLLQAMVVQVTKDGNHRIYSLNDQARDFVNMFFTYSGKNIQTVQALTQQIMEDKDVESYTIEDLGSLTDSNRILIDVRPTHEFSENHIDGAINLPLSDVYELMKKLPKDKQIIAYCRGPYCLISAEVAEILNQHGYQCVRLIDGYDQWIEKRITQ